MNAPLLNGRPVSLHILDYGLFRVHANGRIIGICGYLITTDAGEHVLVDTGFPAKYAEDAAAATTEDALGGFGAVLACGPENLPAAQLALCGVAPAQIDLMVQTHTHIDHIGGIADFPQAPMVIAQAERGLPRPLYWTGGQPLEWPDRQYVQLADDTRIGPGLQVLLAPGHAPGQLALMLDLPDTGPVLLTSDAISRPAEIDERFDTAADPAAAQASAARLMALADRAGAFVIYGHCPRQWPNLRKAPDAYH
ncbi:MAG: MBL fold metallo-hydrolase [Pararhodobacter sp.]|nr:MBL fold metallo-hydrolase [Pararhodobacter sp.]